MRGMRISFRKKKVVGFTADGAWFIADHYWRGAMTL